MNHNDKNVINDKNTISNKIDDYRIWTHKSNGTGENLFSTIDKNLFRIKQQSSNLSGENKAIKQNKKIRKINVIRKLYFNIVHRKSKGLHLLKIIAIVLQK